MGLRGVLLKNIYKTNLEQGVCGWQIRGHVEVLFEPTLGAHVDVIQITYWVILKYLQEFKFWIRLFSSSLTTLAFKTTPNLEYIKCHQRPGEFVL